MTPDKVAPTRRAAASTSSESHSWASSAGVRRSMRSNRGSGTGPELKVRRELHRRGLRYFVGRRPVATLRRTADLLFPRLRLAVCIDGCFWHGCPAHHTTARTNAAYWRAKVIANVERDRDTDEKWLAAGWTVMRFWEHEDPTDVCDAIERHVRSGRSAARAALPPGQ